MSQQQYREVPNHEEQTCASCRFFKDNKCVSLESSRSGMFVRENDKCKTHERPDMKTGSLFGD
ncbi:hypothetical protein ACM66T_10035 [Sulfurimonas sp. ST-25]|uniref:hypothetical protein n=1 Tax=Sulfurimonas sp. ST-25 TaxID=3400151 RepID=UPI003A84C316